MGDSLKAQSALEFLLMFSLSLLIFAMAVFMYTLNMNEADAVNDRIEATRLCLQVSSAISSFSALGGNSTYTFDLPKHLNYKNYTVWVIPGQKYVRVDYLQTGVGCSIQVSNITNSTGGSFFQLEKNATLKNNRGVLVIEP